MNPLIFLYWLLRHLSLSCLEEAETLGRIVCRENEALCCLHQTRQLWTFTGLFSQTYRYGKNLHCYWQDFRKWSENTARTLAWTMGTLEWAHISPSQRPSHECLILLNDLARIVLRVLISWPLRGISSNLRCLFSTPFYV